MATWTEEWPSETGLFLFYGDLKKRISDQDYKPRLLVCEVARFANGDLAHIAGGFHLTPSEWVGIFMAFSIPDGADELFQETLQKYLVDRKQQKLREYDSTHTP